MEKLRESLIYDNAELKKILLNVRTIAMVGASPRPIRPSNSTMKYLLGKGFNVIPVNPSCTDEMIYGQRTYSALSEIKNKIDMINIFRPSKVVGKIVDEAIKTRPKLCFSIIWMQLGVQDDDAAKKASLEGIQVIMNRCPKIEYGRLFGELGWAGVNTGIISSKKRTLI